MRDTTAVTPVSLVTTQSCLGYGFNVLDLSARKVPVTGIQWIGATHKKDACSLPVQQAMVRNFSISSADYEEVDSYFVGEVAGAAKPTGGP